MVNVIDKHPDGVQEPKAQEAEPAEHVARLEQQVVELQSTINVLHEELRLLRAQKFGPRSEVMPAEQGQLFNEAEAIDAEAADDEENIEVPAHRRKKGGRKPLAQRPQRSCILSVLVW